MIDAAWVVGADLCAEAVLKRRDDAPSVRVVLRVRAGDDVNVNRQAELEAANLHVAFLDEVQQSDLDPFSEVWEFVDGEDAAVGAGHQAVMDGELVGKVLALRHPDGIDLADQVGDRGVGRGQLLAVTLLGCYPTHGDAVALGRHSVPACAADRRIRIVVDLAAIDHRDLSIQQAGQRSDQPALGLAASRLASDRISRLLAWPRSPRKTMSWPDRMAFSIWGMTDPSKPMMPGKSSSPALILRIRFLRISCLTGRTRYSLCRSWARVVGCSNGYLFWNVVTPFRFYEAARRSAGFKSASSPAAAPATAKR